MSGLYVVLLWHVYEVVEVMMLAAIVSEVEVGIALRFVAESLRELVDDREEDARHVEEPRANSEGPG